AFVDSLLSQDQLQLSDIDLVISHQASGTAMGLLSRRLGIDREKLMYILPQYGNMIAASIPLALHKAIEEKRIHRGDRILLLGTSAGLSLGGLVLEY
ncbi:MAG TPA: 3-oxoacyl-[acyl-carrier-protein] synthase III C-terminal domain-containing protein, partial [Pseudogracilibacillus sp.]|nr:3-oxoacyl-[acyl-carrier-protein] synthase III C-terminal domain-containing protein [Pseudogracilibacillus sp.]